MKITILTIACVALATAGVAANLVTNGSFSGDVHGWWYNPDNCALHWQSFDALDNGNSGSLSMTINHAPGTGVFIRQCVEVIPGETYVGGARVMIPAGQPKARANASGTFYASTDCSGRNTPQGWVTPYVSTASGGYFTPIASSHIEVPSGAHSVSVDLSLWNIDPGTVTAYFDDVTFGPEGLCVPDPTTLCFAGGRFSATATYAAPGATASAAHMVQLTADSGYMWFFDSGNVEVTMKLLQACAVNNRQWVFVAGMTNVKVVLTVTDLQTSAVQQYSNPQGNWFQPILDTSAFSCP